MRFPPVSGLLPEQLNALLRITDCDVRRYARGAELCSPASFRKELAIVLSGQILVTKGGGELVVSALSPAISMARRLCSTTSRTMCPR